MTSTRTATLAAAVVVAALACACQSTNTPGNSAPPSNSAANSRPLAYAQCIRAHGVPDFPDPVDGHITLPGGPPGGSLDPASPRFQAAARACQSLAPNATPGAGAP